MSIENDTHLTTSDNKPDNSHTVSAKRHVSIRRGDVVAVLCLIPSIWTMLSAMYGWKPIFPEFEIFTFLSGIAWALLTALPATVYLMCRFVGVHYVDWGTTKPTKEQYRRSLIFGMGIACFALILVAAKIIVRK